MSKVIAVNSGSSSLKFQLFQMPEEEVLTSGVAERIGQKMGIFTINVNGEKIKTEVEIPDHKKAVDLLLEALVKYGIVKELSDLTNRFQQLPSSENKKEHMLSLLQSYNIGMAKLKQFDPKEVDGNAVGFNYDNPDELVEKLGMTSEEEVMLTTVLSNELKHHIAKEKKIPFYQIELKMTHVKDVKIDYDYLTELVEKLLNQVHEGKKEEAEDTKEKIYKFANGLEDRNYANKIKNAAIAIIEGHYPPKGSNFKYPAKLENSEEVIQKANNISIDRILLDFRVKWGITEVITSAQMRELFSNHSYGKQDLDDTGQIKNIIAKASIKYKELAHNEKIQALSKIKYRNSLREAIYKLADEQVGN